MVGKGGRCGVGRINRGWGGQWPGRLVERQVEGDVGCLGPLSPNHRPTQTSTGGGDGCRHDGDCGGDGVVLWEGRGEGVEVEM